MAAHLARNQHARAAAAAVATSRSLMEEAKFLAREHVAELEAMLARVMEVAAEVAAGGEAYPAGVRDNCARLESEVRARAETLGAILHHTSH